LSKILQHTISLFGNTCEVYSSTIDDIVFDDIVPHDFKFFATKISFMKN